MTEARTIKNNGVQCRCFFLDRDLCKGSIQVERFFNMLNANVAISRELLNLKAKHVVTVFTIGCYTKDGIEVTDQKRRIIIYYENGYHYTLKIFQISEYTGELELIGEETNVQLRLRCELTGLLNSTSIN